MDELAEPIFRASGGRPYILTDIVLVPLEEGVLIDGLARQEMIRGPLAQTVLPELIKLLDGTRTIDELVTDLPGVPEEYLHKALSLLTEWGILQWDQALANQDGSNPETLAFLRRCISGAGLRSTALDAYARIRNADLVLGATGDLFDLDLAGSLASLLMQTGFQSVRLTSSAEQWPENALFISLSPLDFAQREGLNAQNGGERISWLRTAIDEQVAYADVGPAFRADEGSCYRCFRSHHGEPGKLERRVSRLNSHFWASILATEIAYLVALPEIGVTGRDFKRFDIRSWQSHKLSYVRLPGCSQCWKDAPVLLEGDSAPSQQITDTALVYEQYVGLETRSGLEPSSAEQSAATSLGQNFKNLPDSEQISLSPCNLKLSLGALHSLGPCLHSHRRQGYPITRDQLSALLALTAGVREISTDGMKRWAATAGNLGSVELFIAARNVEGLKQGIYFYQAAEHMLATLHKRGALGVPDLMTRALGCQRNDLPDALIFLTGAFHRVARKYGSFAYRLVNLDAGAALSQFHLVARSMDLWSQTAAAWADDLIHAQLDLRQGEHVTAVLQISRQAPRIRWWRGVRTRARPETQKARSWKPVTAYSGLTAQEVTDLLFRESRIFEAELNSGERKIRQELLNKGLHGPTIFSSPKRIRGGLSVAHILSRRRSVRHYSDDPVKVDHIAMMLRVAQEADALDWPVEHERGLPLSYTVLAQMVQGINPGVYEYDIGRHGFVYEGLPMTREQMNDLFVQNEFAVAPFFIWITGNLAGACASYGAAGHRQLLLRAGAAGNRLWMAALGLGLQGSMIAGLIPGSGRRLLGFDGYRKASLFGFSGGYSSSHSEASELRAR